MRCASPAACGSATAFLLTFANQTSRRRSQAMVIDLSDHPQMLHLRIVERLVNTIDRPTWHASGVQHRRVGACAEIAASIGADLVVDSTAATPVLSQPLNLGADYVMHSATKAINGHSDVLAGFLGCKDEAAERWEMIRTDRHDAGAVMGSFEAWLLIRGMRTLPLRVERMSDNALQIAEFLQAHPKVEAVLYPGLPSDPGHSLASKQMSGGFGGLLSVQLHGGGPAALAAIGKSKLFKRATSLGGVESLVEHRHTIEATVPENLLRLSVGIENISDLIADLDAAIS